MLVNPTDESLVALVAGCRLSCENPDMLPFSIVYYHYFRHHKDRKLAYDVSEREQSEANAVAAGIAKQLSMNVTCEVEHFETLPEHGSRYLSMLDTHRPTIVVMQDMRMFAQTAGVKGLRLLRDSIEAGVVPVTVDELNNIRVIQCLERRNFDELWQQKADAILPLTAHIDVEKPHGHGRQRTSEITSLMKSAFEQISRGQIHDRDTLLDYLRSQVELRYANSAETVAVFEPVAWRTYQYKVRRKIEEMIMKTYALIDAHQTPLSAERVWTTEETISGKSTPISSFVAEACIRQLDNK